MSQMCIVNKDSECDGKLCIASDVCKAFEIRNIADRYAAGLPEDVKQEVYKVYIKAINDFSEALINNGVQTSVVRRLEAQFLSDIKMDSE